MRFPGTLTPLKTVSAGATLILLLGSIAPDLAVLASQAEPSNPSLERIRSMAATQHEIVLLLMNRKEFARSVTEAAKIFAMKWPANQEPVLLKELLYFADQFLHRDQAALGLQLLETSSQSFKTTASLVSIWKEKGYLHKHMNQTDKALECFREAQRLEASPPDCDEAEMFIHQLLCVSHWPWFIWKVRR